MMNSDIKASEDSIGTTSHDAWIEQALAEHRQSQLHVEQLGRLPLSLSLKGLMWLLRLYVLFMIAVVAVNVFQQIH